MTESLRRAEQDPAPRRRESARERAARYAESAKGAPERIPLIGRAVSNLIRVNLLDNATRLAAQAFLSALPALLVVAVFAPASLKHSITGSLREQLGLQGPAQQQIQQLMNAPHDDGASQSFGVLGVLVTLASATAMSRALQRVCERAWEMPKNSARLALWRWVVWLLVWLVFLVVQVPLRKGFGAGLWLGVPLTFLVSSAVWWWTQHLLLGGRIRWYPLLPGALLCGVGEVALGIASKVWLPHAMSSSVGKFGPYGVVFTVLSWLITLFAAVTLALVLGRVVAEEPSVTRYLGTRTEPGRW
ncbi:YihY/virulence factor BrkB family protein [Kitasatospora sp. YST-16]|uniref:YhjD/YihY/BrkB family envelope integrity protein n=1 Tax=unclassified Kitasatospora TaxID=2633591 RepID=UPI0004C3BA61|nr:MULTISPECIES: YhjD/YihY/BrkB family envelope integrity protein [unclassified Kitasatospora]WAL73434.1 YihY/virulence factor BrkB family protein [Kitasatospora sp. YST-16]WNW39488.1 YhjD/YihY/BrkB family envelope integrity protein [Streptomyces sp. Li-HN-5-13]